MSAIKQRIGIIGGGQLGKMMILEAKRLGFYVVTLDPSRDCPSHSISDEHVVADFHDENAIGWLANKVDVITYEFEHINAHALAKVAAMGHRVYPSVKSLFTIQNKYYQNQTLELAGIPIPKYIKVRNTDDIFGAGDILGYPMMLKATMGGYDGKGNYLIRNREDISVAYQALGNGSRELMVEEFIDFDKEISIIACRGINGEKVIYPVAQNTHSNSILDTTVVPAGISKSNTEFAEIIANGVMDTFEGVGTFCVEMFLTKDNKIYVNEVAPRPHNSGHYTIEGTFANQFENHIRAITNLPFGCVNLIQPTVMVNLLGESDGPAELVGLEEAYALVPNLKVHYYGKAESKIGRKMGHFTVVDKTVQDAFWKAEDVKKLVKVIGKKDTK